MARVILNIEAESAGDLQDAINDLARGGVDTGRVYEATPKWNAAGAEQPAAEPEQPQAEEKPKRKRRTKAEIEADKKAHDQKQAEKAAEERGAQAEINDKDGAERAEVFGREPDAQSEQPTRQDVDAAMRALLEANGGEQMLGILREFGAINDAGHPKISALDEANYAEAIQKAQAAVVTLKEQAGQAGSVLA